MAVLAGLESPVGDGHTSQAGVVGLMAALDRTFPDAAFAQREEEEQLDSSEPTAAAQQAQNSVAGVPGSGSPQRESARPSWLIRGCAMHREFE